jgi:hypothetical protein
MDIFISWSGARSRAVAEALKEYLPMIVNAFNPWLSCADIDKGARWISELSAALETAKAGIICLTPNNLVAPYVLFESGAISKTVGKARVCPLPGAPSFRGLCERMRVALAKNARTWHPQAWRCL